MCDYEEFAFTCGHSTIRLKCYCHRARNHPNHYCTFVKKLRDIWEQDGPCDACAAAAASAAMPQAQARDVWIELLEGEALMPCNGVTGVIITVDKVVTAQ
ncbi:hypothetical protein VTJ49DRAFT_3177 [Mycothermus thermophilus]|uniref:Uncharacterized protein n=1 Tax=Humicola insolens TaxID=85995 RepID=A0ABR3V832_HUMIN